MDLITKDIYGFYIPLVSEFGHWINNPFTYSLLLLGLVFFFERRGIKRFKLICVLFATLIVCLSVKEMLPIDRPCKGTLSYCPPDSSFPSIHAATAFALMLAFLNKKEFWVFFLFAFIVAFSRVNIGVHTFEDVSASLAIGLLVFYLTHVIFEKVEKWIGKQNVSYSTS
ncbi:phosphatase PAP2 family protein [Candidatus Micrarchaeota archaeon]|nr:phosphatase PAP2 family protein [Candidatus Micrarchaeota archaeon]